MGSIQKLWELVQGAGDGRYVPARVREQLVVTETVSDSTGTTTQARGTIDGAGDFTVDARGKGIRAGMTIGVTRPLDDPTAPLVFDGIDASDDPTAGYADTDPNLPAPAFDAPPYTTRIVASPGSVTGFITVNFLAVPEKYAPSQYLVSARHPSGSGPWGDVIVPHLGGSQVCALPWPFPPGAAVDLKLRARYAWAHADSVASAVVTAVVAPDTGSPGVASTVSVSNATPGQLVATVTTSTVDPALFATWQYEFAPTATGPATATIRTSGQAVFTGTPGNYWVRAAPVSKSGTVGTFTGWTGPTALTAQVSLDTTPPAAWTVAPTIADATYVDAQNVWHGQVRITLAAGHTFEPDYAYTQVRVRNLTTGAVAWYELAGTATGPLLVEATDGGAGGAQVIAADVVGVDLSGNRLGTYSPAAQVTLTVPGFPTGTLTAAVTQKALALLVSWEGVTGATFYEVWRAATPDGAGATRIAARVVGAAYLDPLTDETVVLPTYYYQARSFNAMGAGPVSQTPWPGGTTRPTDAANLLLNSITAAQVAADSAIFNKIVVNDTIMANSFVTSDLASATSTIRISGAVALSDPNSITAFEKVAGIWRRRTQMNGNGFYVYHDDASTAGRFYRDSNGRAAFELNGIRMYSAPSGVGTSEIRLDMAYMRFTGVAFGGGPTYYDFRPAITWAPPSLGGDTCLALVVPNGYNGRFAIGRLHTDNTQVADGVVFDVQAGGSSGLGFLPGSSIVPDVVLRRYGGAVGPYSQALSLGNASGPVPLLAADIVTHRNNATGIVVLGNTFIYYLYFNGSQYVLPGATALINGVTVGSSRDVKRDIADLPSMADVVRRLRPRRFRRREYGPAGAEEFGFVAEEVAALLPAVVRDIDVTPATRHTPGRDRSKGIDYFPLLAACVRGFQELFDAQEARLDDLTARLARLESA